MYLGQEIKQILPGNVAIGGANMGMVPLFSVQWCPSRDAIWAGYVAADGQELSNATYPDAFAGINANNVPLIDEATWQSDPTERGKYVLSSSPGKFRLPDYNGKSAGALGAAFLRGDGAMSTAIAGEIQQDAVQNITGTFGQVAEANNRSLPAGFRNTSGVFTGSPTKNGYDFGAVGANQQAMGVSSDVHFDASLVARTASETRPLNVTGCWVIKLFGAITNAGTADAAQLASDYANLKAAYEELNSQIDFTIIYPNGGSAGSPANITLNSRYFLSNPFPGFRVITITQIKIGANWGDPGWATWYDPNFGFNSFGAVTSQLADGDLILGTGEQGLVTGDDKISPHPFGTIGNTSTAPTRVLVWKVKGAV